MKTSVPFPRTKKKLRSSFPDPFVIIGTLSLLIVLRSRISVFGFGEVVVVVIAVVVVVEQVYSGHGHPLGQPTWHGHR